MQMQSQNENRMWQTVLNRDSKTADAFVYGVVTTGIFCRPTCPARRPKRENVRFFANPGEAQAAGLRPCRRCKPLDNSEQYPHIGMVKEACELLRNDAQNLSLNDLATNAGLSAGHFQRVFKHFVGISPKQYEIACRKNRFCELLQADGRITDAIYDAGYNSSGVAYAATEKTLGMTPSNFQKGAANIVIRYTLAKTALGWLLVAVTNKGVCAIEFGDTKVALHATVKTRFKRARVIEDEQGLRSLLDTVLQFVKCPDHNLELSVDVQGTAFQHQVWQALRNIPLGEQHSYQDIAHAIGKPRAVRAVASACAKNQVALAIPCHRVVRKGGELGGYRWGIERKQRLLEKEAK